MTPDTVTFAWPISKLLNINQERTMHHQVRAKLVRPIRAEAARALADHRFVRGRADILVEFRWPDGRRRDSANWYPTAKACVDGAVDVGVLDDDDDKHVRTFAIAGEQTAGLKGYVLIGITIEEAAA